MNEGNGRPGAVAIQSGHTNAPQGVLAASLSFAHPSPQHTVIPNTLYKTVILSEQRESKDLRFLPFTTSTPPRPIHSAIFAEWVGVHKPHSRNKTRTEWRSK
jgi:hypothetical protein